MRKVLAVAVLLFGVALLPGAAKAQTHGNTLSWSAVPGVAGYNVYKAPGSCTGTFVKVNTALLTVLTYSDTGENGGDINCYYVTSVATTTGAESVRSNEVLLTTPTTIAGPTTITPPVITATSSD